MNETWRERRDKKLAAMLNPDEPAWLVAEKVVLENDVVYFDVVHRWPDAGWGNRRFTYDTFGNVLHFRGLQPISDDELVKLKPEQRIYAHHELR